MEDLRGEGEDDRRKNEKDTKNQYECEKAEKQSAQATFHKEEDGGTCNKPKDYCKEEKKLKYKEKGEEIDKEIIEVRILNLTIIICAKTLVKESQQNSMSKM